MLISILLLRPQKEKGIDVEILQFDTQLQDCTTNWKCMIYTDLVECAVQLSWIKPMKHC